MPGAFPDGDKENEAPAVPAIPHGLANKKRARAASPVDEVEVEVEGIKHGLANKKRARAASPEEEEEEPPRSPKKRRGNGNAMEAQMALSAQKIVKEQMAPKSGIPSPAKKAGGLSLSRLKMLAMPKSRR